MSYPFLRRPPSQPPLGRQCLDLFNQAGEGGQLPVGGSGYAAVISYWLLVIGREWGMEKGASDLDLKTVWGLGLKQFPAMDDGVALL